MNKLNKRRQLRRASRFQTTHRLSHQVSKLRSRSFALDAMGDIPLIMRINNYIKF